MITAEELEIFALERSPYKELRCQHRQGGRNILSSDFAVCEKQASWILIKPCNHRSFYCDIHIKDIRNPPFWCYCVECGFEYDITSARMHKI